MTTHPEKRPITHIFFDLHKTLIDPTHMQAQYAHAAGNIFSARYGQSPEVWAQAYHSITADWDNYYADLDLSGDAGLEHLWEGMYRTTRAFFRIVDIPEPPQAEITALSRELQALLPQGHDFTYPDVKPVIEQLHPDGFTLGIISHAIKAQAEALLEGGHIRAFVTGPIVTPDVAGHFEKDSMFLAYAVTQAKTSPENCLIVDSSERVLTAAEAIGIHTFHMKRPENDLSHLLRLCWRIKPSP